MRMVQLMYSTTVKQNSYFIGKLDGKADSWNEVKTIIPQDLACVRLALSPEFDAPQWNDIVQSIAPLENPVLPNKNDLATIRLYVWQYWCT